MAITYQRNTWETGKVITAKALNDIETGIVSIVEKLNGMDGEVTSQTLTVGSNASSGSKATFNCPVEINGTTAINDNITVGANKYIILSTGPSENNHAATKGYVNDYVDGQISAINNKTINSGNAGIVSSGKLGVDDGITLTLQPATTERLGGIKVGSNLTINEAGVLNATDTTYALANDTTAGLMSAAHYTKLEGIPADATNNIGTVTGISINGGATQSPTNGVVNISVLTEHQDISSKANLDSPRFSGIVNFGDQISIDTNDNKITINQTDITESQINALYNLPSIPPLSSDNPDGTYILQATKNTPEGATDPVITYNWISVSQQESGGEGS